MNPGIDDEALRTGRARVARSGSPDAARREAAERLEETKRMREIEQAILARNPESDAVPTLERVQEVMTLLGDPQRSYPVVHLTGTNGKTTTTRLIELLLREHGLNTGRFTSPHLHDMRERIVIGGEPISPERFIAAYDDVLPFVEMVDRAWQDRGQPRLSYFEVLVCVAYAAFADAPVDVAVVEVGLGGRWDATNVADGQVSVVTPISIDHTRLLGSTVEQITSEKSGIIKPGAITVSAAQEPVVSDLLVERAAEVGARLAVEDEEFGVVSREVAVGGQLLTLRGLAGDYDDVLLPLFGEHQAHNAALALAAVEAFLGEGSSGSTPTSCARRSPPPRARAASRSSAAHRRSSSTRRTTRTAPGRCARPCPTRSPSPGWSGWWRSSWTRTRRASLRSSSRRSTRSSSPAPRARAP
ncbi:hypothetical protein GCM10025862_07370 [Arsenicicoccus piscis]|uniref:Mur ligase central domain-containing protein n=1 Tax=Arsenicicoccus piscis TaxID=673954 RepID=A0ABQ6HJR2_9MICO|nr:hypothetical protein GCM10025862_07370 [Arsenicicoccus piscis]